jgi:two-component system, OmpR family, sensor kinase
MAPPLCRRGPPRTLDRHLHPPRTVRQPLSSRTPRCITPNKSSPFRLPLSTANTPFTDDAPWATPVSPAVAVANAARDAPELDETTSDPSGQSGSPARRSRVTVRMRILAAVLVLAAFGLLLSGSIAYLLLRERVDARIDDSLSRSVKEFRALAADGVDPRTGGAFTTASDLVYTAMQRTVPASTSGMVGLVSGRVHWTAPPSVLVRPERDPDLVARLERVGAKDPVVIHQVTTRRNDYRYVAVPVTVVGDPSTAVLVLAYDRRAEQAELTSTYRTYALVAFGSLVLISVVGWIVAGRLLAPVRLLAATARRITDSDLSDRITVSGHDDLSDLTRTVNAMLDRLETAFASQRNLLDDAGHELRTPLTILRGHLELLDAADAVEVTTTRDLALDEVDRMHRLVDDLVTLAKAERPDFVRTAPVEVGRLTDDVLDKARTLGRRRWMVDARADACVQLDPQRVTQALLQLAANAVKFSAKDTTIAFGSAVATDRVRLWVRDEGQGVRPGDAKRIFERFARGNAEHGVEGSGLGLTIVAAIAEAHGGTVELVSRPGHGATFTLDLPERPAPGGGDDRSTDQTEEDVP